jgi:catechol 2,3-dioxygenase-like lactoylglutathione lyase family enzyme
VPTRETEDISNNKRRADPFACLFLAFNKGEKMAQATAKKEKSSELEFKGGFTTFAVKDVKKATEFYKKTLGLDVEENMGGFNLTIPQTDSAVFVYPKEDHEPAVFTVFNLFVDDIAQAVEELKTRNIEFESYDEPMKTDENGIYWGQKEGNGPNIAWFTDPSGNIISVLEEM